MDGESPEDRPARSREARQPDGLDSLLSLARQPDRPSSSPPASAALTLATVEVPTAAPPAPRPGALAFRFRRGRLAWLLPVILAAQAALSLRLMWGNTAFSDEALYLWSGHLEISHLLYGMQIPPFTRYFSGSPVIYPVLGAIVDSYGGLTAARLLSLAFMLGTSCLLYLTAGRLFGRIAALAATAVFVAIGPVQVLGAFATYDAMALFLLALAAWLTVRAQPGPFGELMLAVAAVVLVTADATKYATALWNPVVIGLAALAMPGLGLARALLRSARLLCYTGTLAVFALLRLGGPGYVRGLMFTTLERQAGGTPASFWTVLRDSSNWIGLVIIVAAIAIVVGRSDSVRTMLLCSLLTAAALLAPLHQAQIHILTSLYKHVAFGAWFAACAVGYALSRAAQVNLAKGWRVAAVAAGIVAFGGVAQASAYFQGWPAAGPMVAAMRQLVRADGCPCLAAQSNVAYYYLDSRVQPGDITSPFAFYYWDNQQRREIHGMPAYLLAVQEDYFHVIELDPDENPAIVGPVARALAANHGYELEKVIDIPGFHRGRIELWQYMPGYDRSGGWPAVSQPASSRA